MVENQPPRLSEEEIQRYVAADPARTTTQGWEIEITSRRLKMWSYIAAGIILGLHIFLAVVVAIGDTGTTVTLVDQWGYFLVGLILATGTFIALRRPRIRANSDGVEVRNFFDARFYPWTVVYGLNFPEGTRFARLELPDFEYVPTWALQSADGIHAIHALEKFRDLEAHYMPED
ncbi:hypothetical membrane protein [Corynebacterium kutscheri]|uniref:Bacterial PH domain n=1 Tax=Corynebacterium kutscheri TaxID=35755 RepID=A0A0F6TDL1_9CORY|nr:PH domain-containing protein [Corynebacterium kutscheri]AKE41289.1 Bacterial PH domain [Corynebacterium kutscheri]VEH08565.1 hypothetical membrane protein [Corynebacterium kutscheri]VEH09611.1 hypothetical membrane protein [Corynebacterium kutscheri]VEH79694.1 hypothetical membrane protein [Corynebacterium kutscheri]